MFTWIFFKRSASGLKIRQKLGIQTLYSVCYAALVPFTLATLTFKFRKNNYNKHHALKFSTIFIGITFYLTYSWSTNILFIMQAMNYELPLGFNSS